MADNMRIRDLKDLVNPASTITLSTSGADSPVLNSDDDDDGPDSFDASPLDLGGPRAVIQPRHLVARGTKPLSSAQLCRILVAEDNIVNQKVLVAMLKNLGFLNVVIATNGKLAVDIVMDSMETDPIALVFMDCLMPEMDGWEATRAIRKWEAEYRREEDRTHVGEEYIPTKPARLAIIALTAHSTLRDRDECLESGMDDFLMKPVSIEQVGSALHQWLPVAMSDLPIEPSPLCWSHGVINGNILKVPSKLGANDTRSERSYTSYTSSVASSALEEVGFILQHKLRMEDGSGSDESALAPCMLKKGRVRRKSFTNSLSPLIVVGSTSKTRSIQSDCPPGVSIFNMKSTLAHLNPARSRSPVDAALEQADLPEDGVTNAGIYPLLSSMRGRSPDDPISAPVRGHRPSRSSPLTKDADLKIGSLDGLIDTARTHSEPSLVKTSGLSTLAGGLSLPSPPDIVSPMKKNRLCNTLASLNTLKSADVSNTFEAVGSHPSTDGELG